MSHGDIEPSEFHGGAPAGPSPFAPASRVTFDRRELNRIVSPRIGSSNLPHREKSEARAPARRLQRHLRHRSDRAARP